MVASASLSNSLSPCSVFRVIPSSVKNPPLSAIKSRSPFFGAVPVKLALNVVVEFESKWSFAFFVSKGEENAEALKTSSLTVLITVPRLFGSFKKNN